MVHQSDYIVGRLTGEYGITDYSNALKSGFDLKEEVWPELLEVLGLDRRIFPSVIPRAGHRKYHKRGCGGIWVFTGYRGCCRSDRWLCVRSLYRSSQKRRLGSIIGTTMVLKGVTKELFVDAGGSSYSHKLPPGTGCLEAPPILGEGVMNDFFEKEEFEMWNRGVMDVIPTKVISYPLHGRGERFPFLDRSPGICPRRYFRSADSLCCAHGRCGLR